MHELSIVFQGSMGQQGWLDHDIWRNLHRTRLAFPAAEIIVSSWRHTPQADNLLKKRLSRMDIHLVLNDDPGPLVATDNAGSYVLNLNRLLISTRAGLAKASRPLAVKLRTDCWLSKNTLQPLLEQHVLRDCPEFPRDPAFQVFRRRVINAAWFARDARGCLPYLFHPGDIMLAGLTEDVRLFFSAPLADLSLFRPAYTPGRWNAWRYVSEQWLWLHAIKKATGKWVYDGNFNDTKETILASEQWFAANFVTYSARALSLHWPKYWQCYPLRGLFSVYSHGRWRRLMARLQGRRVFSLRAAVSYPLLCVWRIGHRIRSRLLCYPPLRRLALKLFVYRR